MSFYSIASSTSIWRGYDYYKNDKILYCDKITNTGFVGVYVGSNEEKHEMKIDSYINSLKKSELKQLVYDLLYNGPDWQYERFIRDYIEY